MEIEEYVQASSTTVHACYNNNAKQTACVHNDYKTLISYSFPMKWWQGKALS